LWDTETEFFKVFGKPEKVWYKKNKKLQLKFKYCQGIEEYYINKKITVIFVFCVVFEGAVVV
jgi:hypothetical protein